MPKVKEEKTYDRYNFIDLKHRREFDFSLEDNGHEVSLVGEEKYNKNEYHLTNHQALKIASFIYLVFFASSFIFSNVIVLCLSLLIPIPIHNNH